MTIDVRAKQLYAEGAAALTALWDDTVSMCNHDGNRDFHSPRATLGYAGVLLRDPTAQNIEIASRAIRAVLALQETREEDAHHGNFRWMLEDEVVTDLNGVEFVLDGLNFLAREYAAVIPPDLATEMRESIRLGLHAIDRLDVHPSYTNIALSDICNSVLGGETLADDEFVERGDRRLSEWFAFTNQSGAPHEYNSPTYLAVDIARMAYLAEQTSDPDIALKARLAEERLWLHVAAHYHPGLAKLAGPHSRSYFDGWTGAPGYLSLLLWRLTGDDRLRQPTPYAARSREEGLLGVAFEMLHCPEYIIRLLKEKKLPFVTHENVDVERGNDISTYLSDNFTIGAAARSYGVGDPPEPWPAPNNVLVQFKRTEAPGYGTLFSRFVVNDKGVGATVYESTHTAEDWWEEGTFVGVQDAGRAIIAYGLQPRLRPAHSFKLSINMLGAAGAEVRVAGTPVDLGGEEPLAIEAGQAVCMAVGEVFVALLPLAPTDMGSGAPIELKLEGERLSLDIYNYRGPAKTFWEHRSQSGPFFKGNVRNAAIIEVAESADFAGIDAFCAHIAAAMVADTVDDENAREVAYASGEHTLALRYSLWDMAPLRRTVNGAAFVPQMGRFGAIEGTGLQFIQSRDTVVQLGGVRLLAGATPKWLVADDDRRIFVFGNTSDEETPVLFETPQAAVECESFGFGRIEIDNAAGAVALEATGEIGPIRVRGSAEITLTVNGIDVTDMLLRTTEEGVREFRGL
jgi:hypothetical protein